MDAGFYLRNFLGFSLQLVPCAALLLLPCREEAFRKGRKRAFVLLTALSLLFSLCFPLTCLWSVPLAGNRNLSSNLYMLLAVIGVTALFIRITHESPVRKLFVLFAVVSYAAVQFYFSNIVMDFLPLANQDMIYNDATLAAYLLVTVLLLPLVAMFMRSGMRSYLLTLDTAHSRSELLFLAVVLAVYLLLNMLYSALWARLRDAFHLSFVYYIPFSLFLSVLLIVTFYSTIRLSVLKAKNTEQAVQLALIRQSYHHIEENIQRQKRTLHDTRQLLRNITAVAKGGTRESLLKYLDEVMEFTSVPDRRFCLNPCVNGLLVYYAGLAETQGIGFSVHAVCNQLPFHDADLTVLLANVLDNAVRAAAEFGEENPGMHPEIRFAADTVKGQFAVHIENSCLCVSYARSSPGASRAGNGDWLPAEAFLSTHGSGYGLRRMETIAEKYGGHAWFSFDPDRNLFTTRLLLPLNEV